MAGHHPYRNQRGPKHHPPAQWSAPRRRIRPGRLLRPAGLPLPAALRLVAPRRARPCRIFRAAGHDPWGCGGPAAGHDRRDGRRAATAGPPAGRLRAARARAAIGAGVGVGLYSISLWWATGFNAAGYVALVGHGALCMAVAAALVPTRRRWGIVAGLPAALMVADWARERFPAGGLPIGGLALGQAAGPLAATARLGGTLLVTGLTALAGAGLAELAAAARAETGPDQGRRKAAMGLAAVALVVVVVAAGRLGPDGAGPAPHPALRVAAGPGRRRNGA